MSDASGRDINRFGAWMFTGGAAFGFVVGALYGWWFL